MADLVKGQMANLEKMWIDGVKRGKTKSRLLPGKIRRKIYRVSSFTVNKIHYEKWELEKATELDQIKAVNLLYSD